MCFCFSPKTWLTRNKDANVIRQCFIHRSESSIFRCLRFNYCLARWRKIPCRSTKALSRSTGDFFFVSFSVIACVRYKLTSNAMLNWMSAFFTVSYYVFTRCKVSAEEKGRNKKRKEENYGTYYHHAVTVGYDANKCCPDSRLVPSNRENRLFFAT